MNVNFAVYQTVIGLYRVCYIDNFITSIKYVSCADNCDFGECSDLSDRAHQQLNEYFDGIRKVFDLPLEMKGTEFQKKVWQALCEIPYGETRSYKQIAEWVGSPKASRAVGMANHFNPISIIVPCHRVIGTSGELVGYAGGLDIKQRLLDIEKKERLALF